MNKSAVILRADQQIPARFTTAEFLRMGESGAFDDMKVELVEGELVRMNPPMSAHAARQAKIAIRLSRLFAESRIMGEVGVDLGNDTVVGCDVAVLREPVAENRLLVAAAADSARARARPVRCRAAATRTLVALLGGGEAELGASAPSHLSIGAEVWPWIGARK